MAVSKMDVPNVSSIDMSDSKSASSEHRIRSDLYEARSTPGRGIGAFATAFIASGTRIFCEDPLLLLPQEAHHIDLYETLKALPEEKQAAFWALAASSHPSKDTSHIEILRKSYEEKSSEDFNAFVDKHELAWSIYETNRFTVRLPDRPKMLGIFPMSARLNHSCAPNVFHRFNPSISRLTVHALRDIQINEELLTSYIDICHPTVVRRRMLSDWGFRCRCTACDSVDREQDHRRRRLEECSGTINRREKERQAANDGAGWGRKDYTRSMSVIERGLMLLEKEGMEESDTLGIFCTLAVRHAVKLNRAEEAVDWAKKAVFIERKCLGEDSAEYRAACELQSVAQNCLLLASQSK